MNFLNKKFIPSANPHHTQPITPHNRTLTGSSVGQKQFQSEANCEFHPTQQIRHMCNQCIEMLCSQCIGDHLIVHKQRNSFPTLSTIRILKNQMNKKIEGLVNYLNNNSNKTTNVEHQKKIINDKIQTLKKDITKFIDEWILNLKTQLLRTFDIEQIICLQDQIAKLKQELNLLRNSLLTSATPIVLKKAYQLDSEKLQEAYDGMVKRCKHIQHRSQCQFEIDWNQLMNALNNTIKYKQKYKNQSILENSLKSDVFQLPLQVQNHIVNHEGNHQLSLDYEVNKQKNNNLSNILQQSLFISQNVLFSINSQSLQKNNIILYKLPSLSKQQYSLNFNIYPLSSLVIAKNNLVVSGGIIAQSNKNPALIIYNFENQKIVKEMIMMQGRSSHNTIYDEQKNIIYIFGGFTEKTELNSTQCYNFNTGNLYRVNGSYKWGGSCIATIFNRSIMKVNIQGVQIFDLQQLKWIQVSYSINFNIIRGIKMEYMSGKFIIFGFNDKKYYKMQKDSNAFKIQCKDNGVTNVISSCVRGDRIYAYNPSGFWIYQDQVGWQKY